MSETSTQQILFGYMQAYKKLYNRYPRTIETIKGDWVVIGGAQMHVREVEQLTTRLLEEYRQANEQKRNVVERLIRWFKSN